jgi:hypothetical protein
MSSLDTDENNCQGLTDNISLQIDIDRATYAIATCVRNHIIVEVYVDCTFCKFRQTFVPLLAGFQVGG